LLGEEQFSKSGLGHGLIDFEGEVGMSTNLSMRTNQNTGGFHYAYMIVAACCAISIAPVTFTFSCAGIFFNPVSQALGVGKGAFAIYLSVAMVAATLTLLVAGKIFAKYAAPKILAVNVIIVAAAFAAMSTFTSVYQFYVAGAFLGVAMAFLLYLMVPTMINRWFKTRVGFFMGLCSAFTGIGGVLFNPFGGYMIANYGWRAGYLSFAVLTLVIALPFALLMRSHPADKGLKPYGDTGEAAQGGASAQVAGVTYGAALTSGAFYLSLIFSFLVAFNTNINFYLPSYATSLGMSITLGATVASASMFGNMIGKVLLGAINDKSVFGGLSVAMGAGFVGLGLMVFLAQVGTWVVLAGGFLYGISYAGVSVQTPLTMKKIFGNRDYSQIYANIAMAASLSSAIGSSAWGFFLDATKSYTMSFGAAMGIAAIAFVAGSIALQLGKKLEHTA
jgi:MFS family permease